MQEKRRALDENAVATIVGPGTVITGEIVSKGTVHVEGSVHGRVECEDTIVIQESGQVQADLIAGQIIISGSVEGNTFAHERLEITNQGKVVGNITAPRISIADGVIFEGQCTMKPVGQAQAPERKGQAQAPERKGQAQAPERKGQAQAPEREGQAEQKVPQHLKEVPKDQTPEDAEPKEAAG